MNALRTIRLGPATHRIAHTAPLRSFSVLTKRMAEGDTGSPRTGGMQRGDTWTKREKAAEDMYIKQREKAIMELLKEKIVKQEEQLAKDIAMLAAMEDQYGTDVEERDVLHKA